MADEKVLSFEDVVLRTSDMEILKGPHYINDRIIEFCFADIASDLPTDIILVPPSISFWIANCVGNESLRDAVVPLKLLSKNLVIFTVNDNEDMDMAEGGQHWSILVYDREENLFVHHDSMPGTNRDHAEQLYRRVKMFMGSGGNSPRFTEGETPMQENGYDCGLYVVAIARVISRWHSERVAGREGGTWVDAVMAEVDVKSVGGMREQIAARIYQLRG